jgi:hypothetical protein
MAPDLLRICDRRGYTNSMIEPVAPAPTKPFKVRRLETHDAASYRELRLEGLKNHPEAFASSWEYEAGKPVSWWADRLATNALFGGWLDGPTPVGVAGFHRQDAAKLRHKGVLWGMYVGRRREGPD